MTQRHSSVPIVIALSLLSQCLSAQDSTSLYARVYQLPNKLFGSIRSKSQHLQDKLTKQTEKYLSRLQRQEKKMQRKLFKKDPVLANQVFGDVDSNYNTLRNEMTTLPGNVFRNVYSGKMDSVRSALQFFQEGNL